MSSKEDLMEENRLPGATLPLSHNPPDPPAYPDLERYSRALQLRLEQHEDLQIQQPQAQCLQQPIPIGQQPAISFQPAQFGTRSHLGYCPICTKHEKTLCDYESNTMTHIFGTLFCMTTCLCCVPYNLDTCKTARHYCRYCYSYLGAPRK